SSAGAFQASMALRWAVWRGPKIGGATLGINREEITMARNISRRRMLSLTTAAVGGVTTWAGGAQAAQPEAAGRYRPGAGSQHTQHHRPYCAPTYSGGPVHVTPLPPGLPGKHYKPVVVPTGQTL